MDPLTDVRPAPTTLRGALRELGPGLIITGSIVGSGELIVTTGVGASAGFTMLWLVVLGCLVKVFVQIELGRHAITSGTTTLASMNGVPGPRAVVSWLLWLWLLMFASLFFQIAGIVGGVAQVVDQAGLRLPDRTLALAIATLGAALLVSGRYRLIERVSVILVFSFTVSTIAAVALLAATPYAIRPSDLAEGFSFRLPESFTWAFAAFGITGVGASELIYYPYWCLEKGYARRTGPPEPGPEWLARARGWIRVLQVDAWTSFVVYTAITAAFYLLGAAVLHRKGLAVEDAELIPTLSHMYRETLGPAGLWVFLVGAFFVLFSTFFVATASNARLFADGASIFGVLRLSSEAGRRRTVRICCVLFPFVNVFLFVVVARPVALVLVGAVAQAIMLPLLALLALHLHHAKTDPRLRAGSVGLLGLWIGFASMALIGLYQAVEKLGPWLAAAWSAGVGG
jgi:manganese transport protein